MRNLYLIVGPSGVGKTTLVERLAAEHGLKPVRSYTTRKPRYACENGHIFLSDEEFDLLDSLVGFAEYDHHRYGVTEEILDTHDLYVIEPTGAKQVLDNYKGPKTVVVIKLVASVQELSYRMKKRGDSNDKIARRLAEDASVFDFGPKRVPLPVDFTVHADGIEETAKAVWEYISYREKHSETMQA